MATTTNYGWTTPDDTALVKDGASAIRTLGSSVDTTTKNLNPETTLGDLAYRSSTANVKTRLALGTAGQVLTVNSGATAPEWAAAAGGSGMTLLSTTTLSGASTTISSISQSYNILYGVVYGVTNATANGVFSINPNGGLNGSYSGVSTGTATSNNGDFRITQTNNPLRTDANNAFTFQIDNYTSAANYKPFHWYGVYLDTASVTSSVIGGGGYRSNTAITSIVFTNYGGNFSTGTVLLYGVK